MTDKHIVYLSLGSNLGDRKLLLQKAIMNIGEKIGKVVRQSSFLETKPWGFESKNMFLNACLCVSTSMTPHELLAATQSIEKDMGRKKKSKDGKYDDRIIDIDILLYDHIKLNDPDLTIPHPYMKQRDFVMKPLKEIMPSDGLGK